MVLRLLEVSPSFLLPPPYSNMEGRKTTRFFKKSSYYITEACTPQKTTSNFVFLKTFSTIWTTTLKGLKTTANCSFFKKSLYSLTATSSGVFSNRPSISLLLNSHMRGPKNDMIFSKLSLFPISCGTEHKKSACLFSEADAHFSYSLFTSSTGSIARWHPPWVCQRPAACSGRTALRLLAADVQRV